MGPGPDSSPAARNKSFERHSDMAALSALDSSSWNWQKRARRLSKRSDNGSRNGSARTKQSRSGSTNDSETNLQHLTSFWKPATSTFPSHWQSKSTDHSAPVAALPNQTI